MYQINPSTKWGEKRMTRSQKISYCAVFTALAMIFSYVEAILPINFGVPGMKLGLANLVNVVGLYTVGAAGTMIVGLVRIVMVGFTFSNPGSMLYALAGGALSLAVMALMKRMDRSQYFRWCVPQYRPAFYGGLDYRYCGGVFLSAGASDSWSDYGRSHWPAGRPGD